MLLDSPLLYVVPEILSVVLMLVVVGYLGDSVRKDPAPDARQKLVLGLAAAAAVLGGFALIKHVRDLGEQRRLGKALWSL